MIAIIDSGVGNVRSLANALEYVGAEFKITTNSKDLIQAEKIIFPGDGSFHDGMQAINRSGLISTLRTEILEKGKIYLGICLGMQLLAEKGYEDGEYDGLGWIKGKVRKLEVDGNRCKLPHIGWNNVLAKKSEVLFKDLEENPTFYFLHSYIVDPEIKNTIAAHTEHGESFAASIHINNIFGVQFHPEKSQQNGLQLLKNFVSIKS